VLVSWGIVERLSRVCDTATNGEAERQQRFCSGHDTRWGQRTRQQAMKVVPRFLQASAQMYKI